tara:strand:- start:160 stop:312 length:153 start_codon:yes stop_codon:yes gene_type:complete
MMVLLELLVGELQGQQALRELQDHKEAQGRQVLKAQMALQDLQELQVFRV